MSKAIDLINSLKTKVSRDLQPAGSLTFSDKLQPILSTTQPLDTITQLSDIHSNLETVKTLMTHHVEVNSENMDTLNELVNELTGGLIENYYTESDKSIVTGNDAVDIMQDNIMDAITNLVDNVIDGIQANRRILTSAAKELTDNATLLKSVTDEVNVDKPVSTAFQGKAISAEDIDNYANTLKLANEDITSSFDAVLIGGMSVARTEDGQVTYSNVDNTTEEFISDNLSFSKEDIESLVNSIEGLAKSVTNLDCTALVSALIDAKDIEDKAERKSTIGNLVDSVKAMVVSVPNNGIAQAGLIVDELIKASSEK